MEALGFRQLAPKLNQHFNRVLDTPLPLHCRRYSEDLDLGRLACCRGLGIPARQRDSKMDGNGVRWFEPTGLQRAHCRGMPACSVWVQGPECVIWCSVPLHMGLPVQRTDLQSFEAALRLHASWKPSHDPLRPKNMEQIHYASSIHRDPFHFGVWDSQTDSPLADSESGGSRFGFKVTVGPADPGWVCQWVWNGVHTSPCTLLHTLPFFSPPSFHTISLSLAITCGWCNLKLVHT